MDETAESPLTGPDTSAERQRLPLRAAAPCLTAALAAFLAGCAGARAAHEYAYVASSKQYVGARRNKEPLKAGRAQEVTLDYPVAMESVYGLVGAKQVPFQSSQDGKTWTAALEVPAYETLGYDRALHVYAKSVDETAAGVMAEPEVADIPIER